MGTNYYLHKDVCPHCGRSESTLHIGKSSAGWHFALHVIPEEGLNNLDDWLPLFEAMTIRDEYGREVSSAEMIDVITNRGSQEPRKEKPYLYPSWRDFHRENHSEDGLNGLVRSRIDGRHCIGHGSGTWDLITGEFS